MESTKTFEVNGMTCNNCVAKVKSILESHPAVKNAIVKLDYPQAELILSENIQAKELKASLGKYDIKEVASKNIQLADDIVPEKSINTYKPLILIVSFILIVSLLSQFPFEDFSAMTWMRHFMAGFFIVFSFFKFLNLKGFADSYAMYDIIAGKWATWGFIYPVIELTLGLLYLTNLFPVATNIITVIVLGVSSIGVIKSVLSKETIKCACLGDVFNLPMSTVTIIEDVTMVLMALGMLYYLQF